MGGDPCPGTFPLGWVVGGVNSILFDQHTNMDSNNQLEVPTHVVLAIAVLIVGYCCNC